MAMSPSETKLKLVSKKFHQRSGPRQNRRKPLWQARRTISRRKSVVKARFPQNHLSPMPRSISPACMPMKAPLRMIRRNTGGSMYTMRSGLSNGAATSSTRTCVSSATRRLASPERRTSRTVSDISWSWKSTQCRASSLSSVSTKARNVTGTSSGSVALGSRSEVDILMLDMLRERVLIMGTALPKGEARRVLRRGPRSLTHWTLASHCLMSSSVYLTRPRAVTAL
mmetsp:Transcript_60355/g.186861  ORF Transcript_60355/g.186861 Transcript_60355/m.186861 type:complete len:226 (+) Transcript_60355:1228-1905(+)